ncbi:MAG: DoxX family protein [Deltaproteobacteria bacterium]|nr:DoxX family protein [Deltaproteobacteria bacterium]
MGTGLDWALLLGRMLVGGLFFLRGVLALGGRRLGGVKGIAQSFASYDLPFPGLSAWVVVLVELVAGPALVLGLLTQPAAALLIIQMAVATWVSITKIGKPLLTHGRPGFELDLLFLALLLAFLLAGGGGLSLDRALLG